MTRQEIVEKVAEFYEVEPNEESYDFMSGVILKESGLWLNLSSVTDCIEEILENIQGGILND